jgi:hypothetical protein
MLDWMPTALMLADGFTKSLGKQMHANFRISIGLTDETDRLSRELRMEELRDHIHNLERQDNAEKELILSSHH